MPQSLSTTEIRSIDPQSHSSLGYSQPNTSGGVRYTDSTEGKAELDALLTAEQVALRLQVSRDWVWDHSSRRVPYLPVIRMSDGALRYRTSQIEEFLRERERASSLRRKRR